MIVSLQSIPDESRRPGNPHRVLATTSGKLQRRFVRGKKHGKHKKNVSFFLCNIEKSNIWKLNA